jgi:hypothetical protein
MTAVSGFSSMMVDVKGWVNANERSTGREVGAIFALTPASSMDHRRREPCSTRVVDPMYECNGYKRLHSDHSTLSIKTDRPCCFFIPHWIVPSSDATKALANKEWRRVLIWLRPCSQRQMTNFGLRV